MDSISKKTTKKSAMWLFVALGLLFGLIGGTVGSIFLQPIFVTSFPEVANFLGYSEITPAVIQSTEVSVQNQEEAVVKSVEKVKPAVVSIVSESDIRDFFGSVVKEKSAGTGFIVTSDGLIVTNKHVVEDLNAKYSVVTSDGQNFDAEIRGVDPSNDLAILEIEADNLAVAPLGYSDTLLVGQAVIAIGNALGEYSNTVTTGVVSAIDRSITATNASSLKSENLEGLLQTDAAINYGNSGGPLVDLAGNVVGMATAVDSAGEGIGFAIPVNDIRTAVESYNEYGEIVRPFLGVRHINIQPDFAELNNLDVEYGALVYSPDPTSLLAVLPNSPAAEAGIKSGDIITEINGEKIDKSHSLSGLIRKYKPDDKITLKYLRDGDEAIVDVKLKVLENN